MMKKIYLLIVFLIISFSNAQTLTRINRVYTDFNTFWDSGNQGGVIPNNLHSVLGFQWNGTTYSTGVDDTKLATNLPTGTAINNQVFQAFPPASIPIPNSSTYIGVGTNYGGGDGNVQPIPVNNNITEYITDGVQGLGLGTAVFNLPAGTEIRYDINPSINPLSIGDGIPDIVFTQVGQIGTVSDVFSFRNASNGVVGTTVTVSFGSVTSMTTPLYKFYSPTVSPPSYQANLYGTRELRMIAVDWSEFGITTSNYNTVQQFVQRFSGQSDIAFTAYNTKSITLLQSISGNVFNDNNAGTPNGTSYSGATVRLYNSSNTLVATTTTNSTGGYVFPSIPTGNYTVQLTVPTNYSIVSSSDGDTNNTINVTLGNFAVTGVNFGINLPPVANNDTASAEKNSSISINISSNDSDPNSGSVVPSTINLIPPTGGTNIVTDGNGYVKSFTVANVGSWSVNTSGVLTFTPVNGYSGIAPTVRYTIKDAAGLTSNIANINLTILAYCTKTPITTTGGNPSKFGITTQATKLQTWPENIPNGHLVLESTNKGFVITRIQNSNLITDAKEGMLIYDIDAACVKLYNGTSWKCIARDCNE